MLDDTTKTRNQKEPPRKTDKKKVSRWPKGPHTFQKKKRMGTEGDAINQQSQRI